MTSRLSILILLPSPKSMTNLLQVITATHDLTMLEGKASLPSVGMLIKHFTGLTELLSETQSYSVM